MLGLLPCFRDDRGSADVLNKPAESGGAAASVGSAACASGRGMRALPSFADKHGKRSFLATMCSSILHAGASLNSERVSSGGSRDGGAATASSCGTAARSGYGAIAPAAVRLDAASHCRSCQNAVLLRQTRSRPCEDVAMSTER